MKNKNIYTVFINNEIMFGFGGCRTVTAACERKCESFQRVLERKFRC